MPKDQTTKSDSIDIGLIAEEIAGRMNRLSLLTTKDIRAIRRQYSRKIVGWPTRAVINLAQRVLNNGGHISRFIAYELIYSHRPALKSLKQRDLVQLGEGLDSWGAVDMFGCYLSGQAWREKQVPDSLIESWTRSPDRWWRRAALVSTIPLNNKTRGGTGDVRRTLLICQGLIDDRDDMVVKAMSWALRELSKRHPREVKAFLAKNKDRLAARVIREVGHKLSTGLKNPRTASIKDVRQTSVCRSRRSWNKVHRQIKDCRTISDKQRL
ncbi:MAG: DNA alkylation repair protein [Pyrinomonadaceae bacterium]